MLPSSWNPYNIHVNFRKILSAKWKYPETNPAGSTTNCRQFWGELVLLDKQKSLPFLSHRSPHTDRHSAGRGFHAPPPLIIQTTSATTPFVLWAAPAHVDWWACDPSPPPCLIPPYVRTAQMTSLLTHVCIMTHTLTFPFFPFSDWGNEKGKQYAPALTVMTSHYAETHTHFFSSFLALPSAFFSWTVAVDPTDILNYSGMLREAQVPGNLTPTALPSAWRDFLMSTDRG